MKQSLEYVTNLRVEGFDAFSDPTGLCGIDLEKKHRAFLPLVANAKVRILATLASKDLTAQEALARAQFVVDRRTARIGGEQPEALWLAQAEMSIERLGDVRSAQFIFEGVMPNPVRFPFSPGRSFASKTDDPSFEAAALAATMEAGLFVAEEIVEAENYWIFPTRQIGTLGAIVDRRTSRATQMGSGTSRDAWLWAWERRLTEPGTRFVIERCDDPELARRRLSHVYRITEDDLRALPLTLDADWRAFNTLFEVRNIIEVRIAP